MKDSPAPTPPNAEPPGSSSLIALAITGGLLGGVIMLIIDTMAAISAMVYSDGLHGKPRWPVAVVAVLCGVAFATFMQLFTQRRRADLQLSTEQTRRPWRCFIHGLLIGGAAACAGESVLITLAAMQ